MFTFSPNPPRGIQSGSAEFKDLETVAVDRFKENSMIGEKIPGTVCTCMVMLPHVLINRHNDLCHTVPAAQLQFVVSKFKKNTIKQNKPMTQTLSCSRFDN